MNYYLSPLGEGKLRELLAKMKIAPRDLLRTREPLYHELGLGQHSLSDDELISLMVKHPDLIQRPIVEWGEHAVLARPVENVKSVIGKT